MHGTSHAAPVRVGAPRAADAVDFSVDGEVVPARLSLMAIAMPPNPAPSNGYRRLVAADHPHPIAP